MQVSSWSLHYLNARGAVSPFKDRVEQACREVVRRAEKVVEPITLDVVIQAIPGRGIPQIGHVGYVPAPGIMMLTLDPVNPRLQANLGELLERVIAHELHHALRFEKTGYGHTLGEAIVTEGLAGRFAQELYGHDGEIWEHAVSRDELPAFAEEARRRFDDEDYDHGAWFFGTGDFPCWLGYTLGWEIVGHYLSVRKDARPSRLAGEKASAFTPSLDALIQA